MIEQRGDWYFTAKPYGLGRWLGWCAKTEKLGDSPLSIDAAIDVRFEFAESREDVIAKLKREVADA